VVNIAIGQYFPGDSALHKLDPRAKLIFTFVIIAAIFFAKTAWGYAALIVFTVCMAAISRINIKIIMRALMPVRLILIMTFALNVFFSPGGAVLARWQFIVITADGVRTAVFFTLRLLLLVISAQMMTLTTSPITLTGGIEQLLRPFGKIGFPAHELAMMMSIALRFIPLLMEEADKIRKAQMARGADFETGNLIRRAKAMIPLLVPLFVSAFRRADELALAMEARCYRSGAHRTRMKALKFSILDARGAALVAGLLLLVIIV
jgi:energy-coupling factor transport system permease protein